MFDQRGAGRSKPYGELKDNNTQESIKDIEKLRKHLGIEKWLIAGGSWGSTLALAYGEAHPESCAGFLLRGIFLGTRKNIDQVWYGLREIYPEYWDRLEEFIPENERGDLITAYHKRLTHPDPKIYRPAAKAFVEYDEIAASLLKSFKSYKLGADDINVARMFAHYSFNNFFLEEGQLLNNISKINHLPLVITQGRFDVICPPTSAYELHKNWPGSKLVLVRDAGHSASDEAMAKAIVEETEKFKKILKKQVKDLKK
jgi:proline iminopeptidase